MVACVIKGGGKVKILPVDGAVNIRILVKVVSGVLAVVAALYGLAAVADVVVIIAMCTPLRLALTSSLRLV